ncbi:MAG: alpha/beta hydrolase [Zoogloeaceae bacterium]|nr:alpha/beta hydrolase [Zoogloeaceae bacterium]
MRHTTLVVPGFHGSGPAHWQSWFESQVLEARRVRRIDWEAPILARWAGAVRQEIDGTHGPVWLVAHSFGCLAAVVAAADRPERIAGALLVAPADPGRFTPLGLADGGSPRDTLLPWLPQSALPFPSIVVASTNDPWVKLGTAAYWADSWASRLVDVGPQGHINTESGHGPWPRGLALYQALLATQEGLPLGSLEEKDGPTRRGRQGVLARLRHHTRDSWGFPTGSNH